MIKNYRAISLLPILSKITEKIYYFPKNQYCIGYFGSCDEVYLVLMCDMSKAFDCVNHGNFLQTLIKYSPETCNTSYRKPGSGSECIRDDIIRKGIKYWSPSEFSIRSNTFPII